MGCTPICDCGVTMLNTGNVCMPLMKVTKRIDFISVYKSDGTRNGIDLTATVDATTFSTMINNTDSFQRLFPLPQVVNVDDKRGEPTLQKFSDDSTTFIRDGARNFEGYIVREDANPVVLGEINSARCNGGMGVYLTDKKGNYIGILSDDRTKLYPFRLDSASISATFVFPTDSTDPMIKVMFTFHPDEEDACIGMITPSQMNGAAPLLFKGLRDVYINTSAITTTGMVVEFFVKTVDPKNPVRIYGLTPVPGTPAAFISNVGGATSKIRNTTTALDVTLTSATEGTGPQLPGSGIGTYALVFAAQTSGNKIQVKAIKTNYDFTIAGNTLIAIP